jgi:hypothetical protein
VNPGYGFRSYGYASWQVQRRLSHLATLGTEVFYTTTDHVGGSAVASCREAYGRRR